MTKAWKKRERREILAPLQAGGKLDIYNPHIRFWRQQCETWPTAAEWLAWIRRKPGHQMRRWSRPLEKWVHLPRPMIDQYVYFASTKKGRRLL